MNKEKICYILFSALLLAVILAMPVALVQSALPLDSDFERSSSETGDKWSASTSQYSFTLATPNYVADDSFTNVVAVRSRIDWVMTNWYNFGKDDDSWLFVSYDAISGAKTTTMTDNSFIALIAEAYLSTGNMTYLTWLTNAWNDIFNYGIVSGYNRYLSFPNGKTGSLSISINITSHTPDAYNAYNQGGSNLFVFSKIIDTTLCLYEYTGNLTYLDTAVNMTNWLVNYRANFSTGIIGSNTSPRYSLYPNNASVSYNYEDLMSDTEAQTTLILMYQVTGNETYHTLVNTFWDWLNSNWSNSANRYNPDGSAFTSASNAFSVLPDTIEHYSYAAFMDMNTTHIGYFEHFWDAYYNIYWSTNHFSRAKSVPWFGAEQNALIETYWLTGNITYLTWAQQTYDWYRTNYFVNGFMVDSDLSTAHIFDNLWDGTYILRLWLSTGNSTYYSYWQTQWDNNNVGFTEPYGYADSINATSLAIIKSTAAIPLNVYFYSVMSAQIHGNYTLFAGYTLPHVFTLLPSSSPTPSPSPPILQFPSHIPPIPEFPSLVPFIILTAVLSLLIVAAEKKRRSTTKL